MINIITSNSIPFLRTFGTGLLVNSSNITKGIIRMSGLTRHVGHTGGNSQKNHFSFNMYHALGLGIGTLGTVRGCQEYHFNIKDQTQKYYSEDYFCSLVYGLIFASVYLNPATTIFGLAKEWERIKMVLDDDNTYDQSTYYSNQYFGLSSFYFSKSP
jgi:hypothetical protein